MEINVTKCLSHKNAKFEFELCEKVEFENEYISLDNPLNVAIRGRFDGNDFHVKGNISGEINCNCDRCLETYPMEIDYDFEELVVREKEEDTDYMYENGIIPLDDMVINNVLLNLPMQLLCKQDCKGVCLRCYVNLNTDKCKCL